MRVSMEEALRRGLLVPVFEALISSVRAGQSPWLDLMRLADAARAQPDLLRQLRQQVTSLRPQQPAAWRVAVLCDRHLHDWVAAVASVRRCYALGDHDDQLRITEASLLEMLGDTEAAAAVLDHDWPASLLAKVWALRARVWLRLGDYQCIADELGGWLQEQGEQGGGPDIAACWKSLGQALDRLDRYDEAFAAFSRGNPQAAGVPDDALSAFLQAWREVVTPEWLQQWQPVSSDKTDPVFLIGFPRSGTTLLEQGLDAHPEVSAMEEQPALDRALEHYQRIIQTRPAVKQAVAAAPTLAAKLAEILRPMSSLEDHEAAALREQYFAVVNAAVTVSAGNLLIDKMPLNMIHMPFILRLFPQARFLVALRDPADCVFSGFMQHFDANPAMQRLGALSSGAAFYAEVMGLLQQYRQAIPLEDRLQFVRYEELVANWEGVLRGALDFIGVGWHSQVEHYREHARQRGSIATPSYQDVVRPLTKRAAGRWRRYQHLTGEQLAPLQPYRVLWGYTD